MELCNSSYYLYFITIIENREAFLMKVKSMGKTVQDQKEKEEVCEEYSVLVWSEEGASNFGRKHGKLTRTIAIRILF